MCKAYAAWRHEKPEQKQQQQRTTNEKMDLNFVGLFFLFLCLLRLRCTAIHCVSECSPLVIWKIRNLCVASYGTCCVFSLSIHTIQLLTFFVCFNLLCKLINWFVCAFFSLTCMWWMDTSFPLLSAHWFGNTRNLNQPPLQLFIFPSILIILIHIHTFQNNN